MEIFAPFCYIGNEFMIYGKCLNLRSLFGVCFIQFWWQTFKIVLGLCFRMLSISKKAKAYVHCLKSHYFMTRPQSVTCDCIFIRNSIVLYCTCSIITKQLLAKTNRKCTFNSGGSNNIIQQQYTPPHCLLSSNHKGWHIYSAIIIFLTLVCW